MSKTSGRTHSRLWPEVGHRIEPAMEILQSHGVWIARNQVWRTLSWKLPRKLAKTAAGGVSTQGAGRRGHLAHVWRLRCSETLLRLPPKDWLVTRE